MKRFLTFLAVGIWFNPFNAVFASNIDCSAKVTFTENWVMGLVAITAETSVVATNISNEQVDSIAWQMISNDGSKLAVQQSPMVSMKNGMAIMTGGELEPIPAGERVDLLTDPISIVIYNVPMEIDKTSLENQGQIMESLKTRYSDEIARLSQPVTCELLG